MSAALSAELATALNPGDVLFLEGELGAGKTSFVAALLAALGGEGPVSSPTFTLENRYECAAPMHELVHVDLYRLPGPDAFELLPSLEESQESGALLCLEWGRPLMKSLGAALCLEFSFVEGAAEGRKLQLSALGGRRLPTGLDSWKAA